MTTIGRSLDETVDDLARSFGARLAPSFAPKLPATVRITVVTESDAFERCLQLDRTGVRALDGSPSGEPDLAINFEHVGDLQSVERGAVLLMSLLRLGRASIHTEDAAFTRLITTMRSAEGDPEPMSDLLADFPGWIVGQSERAITKMVRRIGVSRLLMAYSRAHIEALAMSDITAEIPAFTVTFSIVDDGEETAVQIGIADGAGFHRPVDPATVQSDAAMRWMSATAFGRYYGRLLDFRDAILNGDCMIGGDRALGAAIYGRIGRHNL